MQTAYKSQYIKSPFQVAPKKPVVNIQDKNHPVQQIIRDNLGAFEITADFVVDQHTLDLLKAPGLVAFLCLLKRGSRVLSEGRGMALLSQSNKYIERNIQCARNAALIDAVAKASKILDTLQIEEKPNVEIGNAYKSTEIDASEPATEKQLSYLRQLVSINVDDEHERENWASQLAEMTKEEASEAIQGFAR